MKKSTRYLLALCIVAVAGVLVLQLFWLRHYYYVNKSGFEKEVNMAFEDAMKKEFSLRCDTIEQLITKRLLDTSEFSITANYSNKYRRYQYTVANKHKLKDKWQFSNDSLTGKVDDKIRARVAITFARALRDEDFENHQVYYRTQNLGKYMLEVSRKYDFDTARLRPVLQRYLSQREITVPFAFALRNTDSTVNKSDFKDKLFLAYPVISRAIPTYKPQANQHFVRAMFKSPNSYILSRMWLMFAGSLLLICTVAFSLFYLLRSLMTEKKLSAIKNDFISNITHEFKTPIASISAAVEAMSDFGILSDEEKTQRYLMHSKNEIKRLSSLVDKVLNISMYEKLEFDINPERLDISELIHELMQNQVLAAAKPVHYTYKNNTPVSELYADKLYFQHALNNVIDNSIKYSGDEVSITIECTLQNQHLVVVIKDNGMGIERGEINMIFEKFYRVPTGNRHRVKGHGLGLNYVKSIIERHRGWYRMESEYGKGSTLFLGWPI
jgi:two-component system phosphate regulon sensor histidine kinase PhoR